ncbi:hypothetical protein HNQ07_004619 [Deinococcus metalli]|uniref:Uncharacterized protein n=1 Tax=Deinococcus metalli TaxID=1141878 RepID=A0A7W8KJ19_9DEIO|nr:DUF5691 domain-containing protein [Deinococcus metalli]MBB5379104.1 hypothetical protein [Deinococcus metalli]GHF64357.1 hypothetical protein GCM10017781_45290 [Deinococcus metalli]
MSDHDGLLAVALVGTARAPLPPAGTDALGQAAALLTRPDAEGTLLARAALYALAHAAGRTPDSNGAVPPAPALPETRPEVPERAARHLPLVLGTPLLREWLVLCAQAGWRVPAGRLPELLDAARQDSYLRALLVPVLGERGAWLAEFNSEWRFAPPAHGEDAWADATEAGREALWRGVRVRDRQAARDLLATHLGTERAGSRKRLLGALLDTLGADDHILEPLLDGLTTDRSEDVRTLARSALHRLPGSAQNARHATRLRALVQLGKPGLLGRLTGQTPSTLTAPTGPDEHAARDGLPDPTGKDRLSAAALLAHLLEHTHPDAVLAALNVPPATLVQIARQHEQLSALADGAVATGHAALAAALLHDLPTRPDLLHLGPPETLAAAQRQALRARDPERLLDLLGPQPGPWPPDLGTALLDAIRDTVQDAHYDYGWGYRWVQLRDLAALRAHPDTPPPAPLPQTATDYAHRTMTGLLGTLTLRRQMQQDFKGAHP